MNATEVTILLKNAVASYLSPDSIRPNETTEEAARRQACAIRDYCEELRRFALSGQRVESNGEKAATVSAAAKAVAKPTWHETFALRQESMNEFHRTCVRISQSLAEKQNYRLALHTTLAAYANSVEDLEARIAQETQVHARAGGDLSDPATAEEEEDRNASKSPSRTATAKSAAAAPNDWLGRKERALEEHKTLGFDASLIRSVCTFFLLREADPVAEGADTVNELKTILQSMVDLILTIVHHEHYSHLVFNATRCIYLCARDLLRLEDQEAILFAITTLAFCGKVMGSVLPLATVSHLPWRVTLFSTAAYGAHRRNDSTTAWKLMQYTEQCVQDLIELEYSDVVPPTKEAAQVLNTTLRQVKTAVLVYGMAAANEAEAAAAQSNAAAAAAPAAGAGKGGKSGKDKSGDAKNAGGADAAAAEHLPDLPNTTQELFEMVSNLLHVASPVAPKLSNLSLLKHSLDALTALAVDQHTTYVAIPAAHHAEKGVTSSDPPMRGLTSTQRLSGTALLKVLFPMMEVWMKADRRANEAVQWDSVPSAAQIAEQQAAAAAAAAAEAKDAKGGKDSKAKGKAAAGKPTAGAAAAAVTTQVANPFSTVTVGFEGEFLPPGLTEYAVQSGWTPNLVSLAAKAIYNVVASAAWQQQTVSSDVLPAHVDALKVFAALECLLRSNAYQALGDSTLYASSSAEPWSHAVGRVRHELQLLSSMLRVVRAAAAHHKAAEGVTPKAELPYQVIEVLAQESLSLSQDLLLACRKDTMLGTSPTPSKETSAALCHDAVTLLSRAWERIPRSTEREGAAQVFSALATASMMAGSDDAVWMGHQALTAVRLLKVEERYHEALSLARRVETMLAQRQGQYVLNHAARLPDPQGANRKRPAKQTAKAAHEGNGALLQLAIPESDADLEERFRAQNRDRVLAEVFDLSSMVSLDDSMWLRTVRDQRTQLVHSICQLRLLIAAMDEHAKQVSEHQRQLHILAEREANSHLYGEMSRKERRVLALMAQVEIEPPSTVERTELKLLAWAALSTPSGVNQSVPNMGDKYEELVHAAVCLVEIAKRQPKAKAQQAKLKQAFATLQEAQQHYEAKRAAALLLAKQAHQERGDYTVVPPPPLSGRSAVTLSMQQTPRETASNATGAHSRSEKANPQPAAQPQWEARELTTAHGLSLYYVWCAYVVACAECGVSEMATNADPFLRQRFLINTVEPSAVDAAVCTDEAQRAALVTQMTHPPAIANKSPFAYDRLNDATALQRMSSLLSLLLSKAMGVLADARLNVAPFVQQNQYQDDEEHGFDKARANLRNVQFHHGRAGNYAILALELALSVGEEGVMAHAAHQLFNCVLPWISGKHQTIVVLRPLTLLCHTLRCFDARRWEDGPLQYLAARVVRALLDLAKSLSDVHGYATRVAIQQLALSTFLYAWPKVLAHPNRRQRWHKDTILRTAAHVQRCLWATQQLPSAAEAPKGSAESESLVSPPGTASKGTRPAPKAAGKGAASATATTDNNSGPSIPPLNFSKVSLYARTKLFFDDYMPVEYMELLDEVLFVVPGGSSACEQLETTEFTNWLQIEKTSLKNAHPPPPSKQKSSTTSSEQPSRDAFAQDPNRFLPTSFFPTVLLQLASLVSANNLSGASKFLLELPNKGDEAAFPKAALQLSTILLKRREDEGVKLLCDEVLKEVRARNANIATMQNESLKQQRAFLAVLLLHDQSSGTAVTTSLREKTLVTKATAKFGYLRRRAAFRALRAAHLQYDVPFQALANLHLSVVQQRDAERERLAIPPPGQRVAATATATLAAAPPAAQKPSGNAGKAPPPKPAPTPSASGAAPPASSSSDSTLCAEERRTIQAFVKMHQTATRAVVLFNRCYRAQHAYMALQLVVNASRLIVATEPPNSLVEVLPGNRSSGGNGGADASPTSARSVVSNSSNFPSANAAAGGAANAQRAFATEALLQCQSSNKVLSIESIRLLDLVHQGLVDTDAETELLQPVSIKVGQDCLPVHGDAFFRRTTSLQMWLSEAGLQSDHALLIDVHHKRVQFEKIFNRLRMSAEEAEHNARLDVLREWARESLMLVKSIANVVVDARTGATLLSKRTLEEIETGLNDTLLGPDLRATSRGSSVSSEPILTGRSGRSGTTATSATTAHNKRSVDGESAKHHYVKSKRAGKSDEEDRPTPAPTPVAQTRTPKERRFGRYLNETEIVRCFFYAVRGLQYGPHKQSAIAMVLEMNELTLNKYVMLLVPFVANLQNAMGANLTNTLAIYDQGCRDIPRTTKYIFEAKRLAKQYKESDAFRRVQLKAATVLQPSRRGQLGPGAEYDTMSVATSAQTGMGGGGTSAYKDVVASYTVAVNYLRQKHSTLLLVGILYELGALHLQHRVRAEAERAWSDVVDASFSSISVLKNWKTVLGTTHVDRSQSNPSTTTLAQMGLPADEAGTLVSSVGVVRGIFAAASLSSLAMFIYHEHQKKATEACLLAAEVLFAIVASTSLSVPQAEWEHSTLRVDELLVGVDLEHVLGEQLPSITHALLYIAHHLLHQSFFQHAIFAANVAEFFARRSLRSTSTMVYCRLVKAQAAAELGHFSGALSSLEEAALGLRLPEAAGGALGLTIDLTGDASGAAHNNAAQGAQDGKAGKPAAGAGKGKGTDDVNTTVHSAPAELPYDNAKSPADPANVKVVESFLANCFTTQSYPAGSLSLQDAVVAEYGPHLSRQVLLAAAKVFTAMGCSDYTGAWSSPPPLTESAQAPAETGKGGAAKAADPKGGKAGAAASSSSSSGTDSVPGVTLIAAERFVQLLQTVKPAPPAGAPAAAAPPAAPAKGADKQAPPISSVTSSIGLQVSPAEHWFYRCRTTLLLAQLYEARGLTSKVVDLCLSIIDAQNNADSFTIATVGIPSFALSLDGAFLVKVYTLLARAYLNLQQWTPAASSATNGLVIAGMSEDPYSSRELQQIRWNAKVLSGDADAAVDLIAEAQASLEALQYDGKDNGAFGNCAVENQSLFSAVVEESRQNDVAVLAKFYDAKLRKGALEVLRNAVRLLRERAERQGLNMDVDPVAYPSTVLRQLGAVCTATFEYHHALNCLAKILIRTNALSEAETTLRVALEVAKRYDVQRGTASLKATSLLLLAQVLFGLIRTTAVATAGTTGKSSKAKGSGSFFCVGGGNASGAPAASRATSSGTAAGAAPVPAAAPPPAVAAATAISTLLRAALPSCETLPVAKIEEIARHLADAVDLSISNAGHDFEVLRTAFAEFHRLALFAVQWSSAAASSLVDGKGASTRPSTSGNLQQQQQLGPGIANSMPNSARPQTNGSQAVTITPQQAPVSLPHLSTSVVIPNLTDGGAGLLTAAQQTLLQTATSALAYATALGVMQYHLAHNTAQAFQSAENVLLNVSAVEPDSPLYLPPAVVSLVEAYAQRDTSNQTSFLTQQALERAAAAANNPAPGKPGATAISATTNSSSSSPSVTLVQLLSCFVQLHRFRSTCGPQQLPLYDAVLVKLQKFIQAKVPAPHSTSNPSSFFAAALNEATTRFGISAAPNSSNTTNSSSTAALIPFIFDKGPSWVASSSRGFTPAFFPRANYFFAQWVVQNPSAVSVKIEDGDVTVVQPRLTLLLSLSPLTDVEQTWSGAVELSAPAVGGKAPAAKPGGKGAAAAAAATSANNNDELQQSGASGVPVPVCVVIDGIAQESVRRVAVLARAFLREAQLAVEAATQLEDVLNDATTASGGAKGGAPAKAAAAAPVTPRGAAGGAGGHADELPSMTNLHGKDLAVKDQERSAILFAFLQMLVEPVCIAKSRPMPTSYEAFVPQGTFSLDLVKFVATLLQPSAGHGLLNNAEAHQWLLKIVMELQRL